MGGRIHLQLVEVYEEGVMEEGCRLLSERRTDGHNEALPGHPTIITSNLKGRVDALILENRGVTVDELHEVPPCILRSLLHKIVTVQL
jgi:hypothetical protein